ncbi:hypothetical protein D3C81_1954430 [compost metagenome]
MRISPAGQIHQRENADLLLRYTQQFADGLKMKINIQPVSVHEQKMGGQGYIESLIGKRQYRQLCRYITLLMGQSV